MEQERYMRWKQRYTIDISVYHKISNPDLIAHINRVGKTFYKKPIA